MSHRASVLQLESDFADAMTRMYAVGNGLARLRSEIDREDAVGAPAASAVPSRAPRVSRRRTGGPRHPARRPGPRRPSPRPRRRGHPPSRRPLPRRPGAARAAGRLVPPRGRRDPGAGRRGRRHHDGRRRHAAGAGRAARVVRPGRPGRRRRRARRRPRVDRGAWRGERPARRAGGRAARPWPWSPPVPPPPTSTSWPSPAATAGSRRRRGSCSPAWSRSAGCTWPVAGAASCSPCSSCSVRPCSRPSSPRAAAGSSRPSSACSASSGGGPAATAPARHSPWCASSR